MKMVDEDGWMLEFRAENDTKWSGQVGVRSPGGFRPKNPDFRGSRGSRTPGPSRIFRICSALNSKIQPYLSTIFIFLFQKKMSIKIMKIKLFGHPFNPRVHGTFPRFKSGKFPTTCTDRELRTTKCHPSYASFTFQVNRVLCVGTESLSCVGTVSLSCVGTVSLSCVSVR